MNNFKTVEVKGYTKNEALAQVPFQVIKDATQAWKNAGKPMTGSSLKEFMAEYLKSNTKFAAGIGCSITVEGGVADTRERPYEVEDVKNEQGKRKYKTAFQIVDENNRILHVSFGTKVEAIREAKALYSEEGFRGSLSAHPVKVVVEGEATSFRMKYAPSKNAKQGTWLAFGVEA